MACHLENRGANMEKPCRNSQDHGRRPIPGKLSSRPRKLDQISAGGQKALEQVSRKNLKDYLISLTVWEEIIVKDS